MWTVPALADALGLSPWGTLRTIWRLRPLMAELCISSAGQPFVFTSEALGLLRRTRALQRHGLPPQTLAARLMRSPQRAAPSAGRSRASCAPY